MSQKQVKDWPEKFKFEYLVRYWLGMEPRSIHSLEPLDLHQSSTQFDQMARLFFQYLSFTTINIWPKSIKRSIHFNENIHYPCDVFLPFCDVMLDPTDDRWEDLLLLIDVQQCAGDQLVNLEQQRLVLAEKTHRRDQWLVSSLTVLDSTKQENMLLFVWSKATESEPVKLEASHTVILGSI